MTTVLSGTHRILHLATALLLFSTSLSCQERTTWESHWTKGNSYFQQRDFVKAESELKAALTLAEKGEPNNPQVTQTVAGTGILYDAQHRFDEAQQHFERTVRLVEQTRGLNHLDLVAPLNNLGAVYAIQHHYDKATLTFERALAIQEHDHGETSPLTRVQLKYLGATHLSRVQYEEAEPFLSRVLELPKPTPGTMDKATAEYLDNYTRLHTAQEEYSKAKSYLDEFDPVDGGQIPKNLNESSASLSRLSNLLATQEQFEKSEGLLRRVLEETEKPQRSSNAKVAQALANLADLYWAWGKLDAAVLLFERSLAIGRSALPESGHKPALPLGTSVSSEANKPIAAAGQQHSLAALRNATRASLQSFTGK